MFSNTVKYINVFLKTILIIIVSLLLLKNVCYIKYMNTIRYDAKEVENFFEFKRSYTKDFSQYKYGTNCGPTMFFNVLAYYEVDANKTLLPNVVDQKVYDDICEYLDYNQEEGMTLQKLCRRIKQYISSNYKDSKCTTSLLKTDKWYTIRKNIDENNILLLAQDNHVYMIGGYLEMGKEKYIKVFTTWEDNEYGYLKYNKESSIVSIDIN